MNSTARKHHYLPQAYLAAFTDTGTKYGKFYVIDIQSRTCFRTSPNNVAAERDFNRVDVEGEPPDVIEQVLSPFEDRAVQAIRNVIRTETFPTPEDYNYIINLLCLIAIRNPQFRKSFNRSQEVLYHLICDHLVSAKKIFDHHLKKAQEAGYVTQTDISFEDMKQFIEKRRYRIEIVPEVNLREEFHAFPKLLAIMGQRIWSLLVAPSTGPGFICSDHPVALTWKNSLRRGPIGYGLKNTEAFFPLSPRTGLYGVYEKPLLTVFKMNLAQVAAMNGLVAQSAERHVFCETDSFYIWYNGEIIKKDCVSD
jgi:hypothetical protein